VQAEKPSVIQMDLGAVGLTPQHGVSFTSQELIAGVVWLPFYDAGQKNGGC